MGTITLILKLHNGKEDIMLKKMLLIVIGITALALVSNAGWSMTTMNHEINNHPIAVSGATGHAGHEFGSAAGSLLFARGDGAGAGVGAGAGAGPGAGASMGPGPGASMGPGPGASMGPGACDGTGDGSGDGSGAGHGSGYGPGDGTGNDGQGPEDGTGYGATADH